MTKLFLKTLFYRPTSNQFPFWYSPHENNKTRVVFGWYREQRKGTVAKNVLTFRISLTKMGNPSELRTTWKVTTFGFWFSWRSFSFFTIFTKFKITTIWISQWNCLCLVFLEVFEKTQCWLMKRTIFGGYSETIIARLISRLSFQIFINLNI